MRYKHMGEIDFVEIGLVYIVLHLLVNNYVIEKEVH